VCGAFVVPRVSEASVRGRRVARTIWGEDSYNSVVMSTRRALRWLAAMVALLVFGTVVGLFWADTSDVAGSFAVATNIISVAGIVILLTVLALNRRRRVR
jgi:membrane protein YdbS with pleckstrin-like domain